MDTSLAELVNLVGGNLLAGDPAARITGFASLDDAVPGDVSYFHDVRYRRALAETEAAAVLIGEGESADAVPAGRAVVAVSDPSRAFEEIVDRFGWHAEPFAPGIHPTAVIAETAVLDRSRVSVGAHAVIADHAVIGEGVEIGAGCYVGRGVQVGEGSVLRANVTVHAGCQLGKRVILHSGVVVGADGFGYEFQGGRHRKIRQAGRVQIDDDVEIGAGTTIDRARFGRTWIGQGTKIDNLVQIGHNVVIGRHCIIVAGCAIAGSARLGDYVVMAAQCGVAGHVKIGSGARLGSRCGVTKDLAGGATYLGFPAVPAAEEKRRLAGSNRMKHLVGRVAELERTLAQTRSAPASENGC